jgi:hypothetical protein
LHEELIHVILRPQTVVVAQLVRAPDCGSGGRRFETDLPPSKQGDSKMSPLFLGTFLGTIFIDKLKFKTSLSQFSLEFKCNWN